MNAAASWGLIVTLYATGYIIIEGIRSLINKRKPKPMATEKP